jgi:hypothetical protein
MELPLTLEKTRQITNKVYDLMTDYWERPDEHPYDLLPKSHGIPQALTQFADYVVIQIHSSDWGKTPGFPSPYVASTLSLFQVMDVKDVGMAGLGGYGSWLYRGSPLGVYNVVFDNQNLNGICGKTGKRIGEVKTKLYLHELGHLVLHGQQLFRGVDLGSQGQNAEADMEAEAWLFAAVVFGIAVGDQAHNSKVFTFADNSWQYW